MQIYTEFDALATLTDTRQKLLENDKTIMSCHAGTTYPSDITEVGMLFLHTGEWKLYQLQTGGIWKLIIDLNQTITDKEYADLQNALKLDKSGGTMTGALNVGYLIVNPVDTSSDGAKIKLSGAGTYQNLHLNVYGSQFRITNNIGSSAPFYITPTSYTVSNNKGWHSGNMGTGSLFDADLLDGLHASDLALTSHWHSTVEVSVITGTISHGGTLPLPTGYTAEQCYYYVSPNTCNDTAVGDYPHSTRCWANTTTRVVTVYNLRLSDSATNPGVANYMVIGVK